MKRVINFDNGKAIHVDVYRGAMQIWEDNSQEITPQEYSWIGCYLYLTMLCKEFEISARHEKLVDMVNKVYNDKLDEFVVDMGLDGNLEMKYKPLIAKGGKEKSLEDFIKKSKGMDIKKFNKWFKKYLDE